MARAKAKEFTRYILNRSASGNKYHEEEYIFVKDKTNTHRMTTDEFESGDYEPCGICLPHANTNTESGNEHEQKIH